MVTRTTDQTPPPQPDRIVRPANLGYIRLRFTSTYEPTPCISKFICGLLLLIWRGTVWYGVVWCVVVRCGMVWCGVVWVLYSVILFGVVWCGAGVV